MRRQHASRGGCDARQRRQLRRLRDHPGKISETGRESDRAIGHRILDHRLHLTDLRGGWIARVGAHDAEADTSMTREMRDVEREALAAQKSGEAGHRVPSPVELTLAQ